MGLSYSTKYKEVSPFVARVNDTSDVIYSDNNVSNVSTNVIETPDGIKDYPDRSLHDWSLYGNYEEVIWLIQSGSNVNEMDENGRTPLYSSIKYPKIAKALLDNGCSLSSIDIYERTPLIYACERLAPIKTIKLFISSGSDVNAKDKYKNTPLHFSSKKGQIDVVNLLLANGAERYRKDNRGKTPYENTPKCFKEMMSFLK